MIKNQKLLRRRIIEISYQRKLSHLGSCLSAVDLIDVVYEVKKKEDLFILSSGHAGLAWYVVLEKNGFLKAGDMKKLSVHPDRNSKLGIHVSTGSLGLGLPIAVGMALADRSKNIFCLISDGECAEGSIWESFRTVFEQKLSNLTILLNANSWGAYGRINIYYLRERIKTFGLEVISINGHNPSEIEKALRDKCEHPKLIFAISMVEHFPFLSGLDAHYYEMKKEDYELALSMLK